MPRKSLLVLSRTAIALLTRRRIVQINSVSVVEFQNQVRQCVGSFRLIVVKVDVTFEKWNCGQFPKLRCIQIRAKCDCHIRPSVEHRASASNIHVSSELLANDRRNRVTESSRDKLSVRRNSGERLTKSSINLV